jgi:very-short-patch-repair endonuclease
VITTQQLIDLGFSPKAIKHRVARRRLHPLRRGVYAVGRLELTLKGQFMAAVLACGDRAVLSHESAAMLWGIREPKVGPIHVSIPSTGGRRRAGVVIHRRRSLRKQDVTRRNGIPVTTPICTLIDEATRLTAPRLERAINRADELGLTDPEEIRCALDDVESRPGVKRMRELLDRRTFRLTRSELERRFLAIVRRTALPPPLTRQIVNGFEVDFYWPDLGLIVESDGLRYHRTPQQQTKDLIRDQFHTAAGFTRLRYSHAQIAFDEEHVETTLLAGAARAGAP